MSQQFIYKLPNSATNILTHNTQAELSNVIEYPKFTLGFHHYIHQNKDKLDEVFPEFANKKKVYLVMNKFEKTIDDYDKTIEATTVKHLGLKSPSDIGSRSFYKFWEILVSFDLFPKSGPTVTAHIANKDASLQAATYYRSIYGKNKDDKHHTVQIKHAAFKSHLIRQKNQVGGKAELFEAIKDKADLVMAYSGYNWTNNNVQEQDAHRLLLAEIIIALKIQSKGGNFVCKLYESFTHTTLKLISILMASYESTYIVKPFMSRSYNSEKFIVCVGYKQVDNKVIDKLEELFNLLVEDSNKDKYISSIFPDFKLTKEITDTITKINTDIANTQLVSINEIMEFLNGQNYRGDVYHARREKQIAASEFWISRFIVDSKNIGEAKEKIIKSNEEVVNKNNLLIGQLAKLIK